MSCQIIPLNPLMLCWSWSRMCYHGWWSGKKSTTKILKSRAMCFKSPLPIKTTARQNHANLKQKPHKSPNQPGALLFPKSSPVWVPGAPFLPCLGMLAVEPSTELRAGRWSAWYGSWPHLSGNCYRWFDSLAARTPSKHHPRVWGPHLD